MGLDAWNHGSLRCVNVQVTRFVIVISALVMTLGGCGDEDTSAGAIRTSTSLQVGATAVWELGSDASLTASSQTFTAMVSRLACSGGETGEVFEPTVESTAEQVMVTFTVAPLPEGDHTCPGNDRVPFVVDLGEPLGERSLWDGACDTGEATRTSFCASEAGGGQRWPADRH